MLLEGVFEGFVLMVCEEVEDPAIEVLFYHGIGVDLLDVGARCELQSIRVVQFLFHSQVAAFKFLYAHFTPAVSLLPANLFYLLLTQIYQSHLTDLEHLLLCVCWVNRKSALLLVLVRKRSS